MPTNIPSKEADQEQVVSWPERREGLTNWTPWIVGACLVGEALVFLRSKQTRSPALVAAGPIDSAPKQPVDKPPGAKQLKTSSDPFYMEKMHCITVQLSLAWPWDTPGLARWRWGVAPPKLDFTPRDVGMVILDVALAMTTKDALIKQGIIPADIMK